MTDFALFLVTPWKLGMYALLAVLLLQRIGGRWPIHKIRTWGAMLASSVTAYFVAPDVGYMPLLPYIMIDFLAAIAVLTRPAGLAQKAIGLIYGVMILYSVRFAISNIAAGEQTLIETANYATFMAACGWCQFVILLVWSANDAGRIIRGRSPWDRRHLAVAGQAGGPNR